MRAMHPLCAQNDVHTARCRRASTPSEGCADSSESNTAKADLLRQNYLYQQQSCPVPWRSPRPQMWPTMDMTAAVRMKARRAACHAAGSAQRSRNQRCMRGGSIPNTLSSRSARRLFCGW